MKAFHGPSRQKVSESIIVNASAETVWDIVKNFKDFKWNEDVKNCLATDNKLDLKEQLNLTKEVN